VVLKYIYTAISVQLYISKYDLLGGILLALVLPQLVLLPKTLKPVLLGLSLRIDD